MDLAARQHASALRSLQDYVEAVERKGVGDHAGPQLLAMARVTRHEGFLDEAAQALERLGFHRDAGQVRRWVEEGGSPESKGRPAALRAHCMRAAIASKSPPGLKPSTA
jgi:hypothetical protein